MGKKAKKHSSSILWVLDIQMMSLVFAQACIQIHVVHLRKARLHVIVSATSVIPEENIKSLDLKKWGDPYKIIQLFADQGTSHQNFDVKTWELGIF